MERYAKRTVRATRDNWAFMPSRTQLVSAAVLLPLALAFLPTNAVTQQTIKTGPEIGASIPAFHAPDQTGRVRSLNSFMGPKGTLLVFFRSADW